MSFIDPDSLTDEQKEKLAEKIKERRREAAAGIAWWVLIIQPAVILFFWNVGIASLAHVQTFQGYWPLLAISLGIQLVRSVFA